MSEPMTDPPTPKPLNRDQDFLKAIVDRLDRQNQLLTDVRDRLPVSAEPATGRGAVELTEPAGAADAVKEPAEPMTQTAKPSTKKPAAKKTATVKRGSKT